MALVDRRHDLLGHQLHRAPRERLVHPVVAGVEQRAEVADLLAERQDLVGDRVRRAVDHQLVDDGREIERIVRLVRRGLEQVGPAAAFSFVNSER